MVAKQVQKEYNCNDEKMAAYLVEVWKMEKHFDWLEVRYMPRWDSRDVDNLAWIASSSCATPDNVILEKLTNPSALAPNKELPPGKESRVEIMLIDGPEEEEDWRITIRTTLQNNMDVERDALTQ